MTEVLQEEEPKQNGDIVPLSIDPDNQQNLHNGSSSRSSVDPDAQELLISSLRSQIQDLFSQVSQLNSKLVKSYDRVSDLEDDLHVASANLRSSSLKISHLELERTQHLSALNTGLLVEKSHVTTELNRLMEKATEEAAQRGQAESARIAIEKELDDLSASLFDQANTMVAEARFAKHLSERKVEDAERALKSAEEAVQLMQVQMQSMQAEREEMEKKSRKMEMVVGKGKWVERRPNDISIPLRLLNSHGPYHDYLAFLSHLRVLHPTSPSPPAMATLLPLPFLARLLNEDSEPTVRLDLAPSLNWLSRRSVLAAIYSGQLTIEPISAASLFAESISYTSTTTIAGMHNSNDNISCAMCGIPVFPVTEPFHPHSSTPHTNPSSWSGSFFKRTPSMAYMINSRPPSPPHPTTLSSIDSTSQLYIFKLASLPTSTMPSLPISSLSKLSSQSTSSSIPLQPTSFHNGVPSASPNNQSVTIYPLCMSGWCLSRLRTTCTLWAFVRTGIVDKVWEEEVVTSPTPSPIPSHASDEKPSLPPRKRGLWGIASAIGERAASWSEGDKDKIKRPPSLQPQEQRRLPPIPPAVAVIPPPLPKRNRNPAMTSPLLPATIDSFTNTQTVPPASITTPVPSSSTAVPSSSGTVSSSPAIISSSPATVPPSPATVHSSLATFSHEATPPPVQETPALPQRSSLRASLLLDQALTPSNIPLPDSRPSTPPVLSFRTTSPIGSGTPPPLPKRAAARGVKAPRAASLSRSGTPVNGLEGSPLATEKISTDPTTKIDEKTESEEVQADVELVRGKGVKEDEEDSKTIIDVPVPSVQQVALNESDNLDEMKANDEINLNHSIHDHVNGVVKDEEKVDSKAQALDTGETDERQYVGDGSWEEKTWKELVRLRENMFWARIGGFRG